MSIRTLERKVIKNQCYLRDGNTKQFKSDWNKYRYAKTKAAVNKIMNTGGATTSTKRSVLKKHMSIIRKILGKTKTSKNKT